MVLIRLCAQVDLSLQCPYMPEGTFWHGAAHCIFKYEFIEFGSCLLVTVTTLRLTVCRPMSASDWRPGGHGFIPRQGRQHSFVEIDHEIFSTVILSLPLIQEGQLSVSGERMCTILVNCLED